MLTRSLFFAPANRPDLVAKFPRISADCFVIDLDGQMIDMPLFQRAQRVLEIALQGTPWKRSVPSPGNTENRES